MYVLHTYNCKTDTLDTMHAYTTAYRELWFLILHTNNYDFVYALAAGGGLQFSVDLSDDDGTLHILVLNVQARYGNGLASL